jgi:hypothetical protein
MPLEFRQDDLVLRVDGDVLEIFRRGAFSDRVPLAWLAVQVQPSIKGHLIVKIGSSPVDLPLYEVMQKAKVARGSAVELVIRTEEEPIYRQFFTQVAQACGRPFLP